jgi:DNA-binding transcriptional MerR regulator
MNPLQTYATQNPQWSLEEFVRIANQLLPDFLPQLDADSGSAPKSRVQEEINPRLVRHYTTQGLLDRPLKQGREARYTYRHLLQILVLRRLLTEGYSSSAIEQLTQIKSNSELEALLQGGVQLTVQSANPALAFLQQIQKRQSSPMRAPALPEPMPAPGYPPSAPVLPAPPSVPPLHWTRLEILPGLEIHVREDFINPSSAQEQQNLLHRIAQILFSFLSSRKRSP